MDIFSRGGLPVYEGEQGEQAAPMGIALYRRPRAKGAKNFCDSGYARCQG